jgi:hypothetical protein
MPITKMTSVKPETPPPCSIQEIREWDSGVDEYKSPLNKEQWWWAVTGASANGFAVAYGGPIAAGATNANPLTCEEVVTFKRTSPAPNCEWQECSVTAYAAADGSASVVLSHGKASCSTKIRCYCVDKEAELMLKVRGELSPDESSSTTKASGSVEGTKDDVTGKGSVETEKTKKGIVGVADSEPISPSIEDTHTDSCMSGTGTIRYKLKTTASMGAYCGAWWVLDRAEIKIQIKNTLTTGSLVSKCKCEPSVGMVPTAPRDTEFAALVREQGEVVATTLTAIRTTLAQLTQTELVIEPTPRALAFAQALEAIEIAPTPELRDAAVRAAEQAGDRPEDDHQVATVRARQAAYGELSAHEIVLVKVAAMTADNYLHSAAGLQSLVEAAQNANKRASAIVSGRPPVPPPPSNTGRRPRRRS